MKKNTKKLIPLIDIPGFIEICVKYSPTLSKIWSNPIAKVEKIRNSDAIIKVK